MWPMLNYNDGTFLMPSTRKSSARCANEPVFMCSLSLSLKMKGKRPLCRSKLLMILRFCWFSTKTQRNHTVYHIPRSTHTQYTAYHIPHTAYHIPHTTYPLPHTRYHLSDITYHIPDATYVPRTPENDFIPKRSKEWVSFEPDPCLSKFADTIETSTLANETYWIHSRYSLIL